MTTKLTQAIGVVVPINVQAGALIYPASSQAFHLQAKEPSLDVEFCPNAKLFGFQVLFFHHKTIPPPKALFDCHHTTTLHPAAVLLFHPATTAFSHPAVLLDPHQITAYLP
ncbi:hypothetical protein IJL65_04080 [bacterium]|nr:hypothetical protein [bacterium]